MAKSPIMLIINSDEGKKIESLDIDKAKSLLDQNIKVLQMPLKFEEDLIEMNENEAIEFRNELEIENNIDTFFESILNISRSICFLTAGKKECRSWIIKKGLTAVEAAGKIHSDIARGFVRAEVIHVNEIIKQTSEKEAKDKGIIKRVTYPFYLMYQIKFSN
mgnify:FL=1